MFHFVLKRWMKAGREVLWGLFFDWLLITAAVLGEEFQSRLTTGWIFITVHRGSSRPIQSRFQKQRRNFVSLCSIFSVLCTKAVSNIVIYHHLCIFSFTLFTTFYIWLKTIPVQFLGIDNPKMQTLLNIKDKSFSSSSIESLQIDA